VTHCNDEEATESDRVVILPPTQQDAVMCHRILHEAGVSAEFVSSMPQLIQRIRRGTGVVLIAKEFLSGESLEHLRLALQAQPSWSDVPVVILLGQQESSAGQIADWLSLGHVTLLERPLRIALFVSLLKAKLRDRKRQYEVRDLLRRAERANESKSAFLANMSHEIRTPMTAILGYADLMEGLIQDEEALNHLKTIRRNGVFLLGIINDILDLSKIEAGKLDVASELFSPTDVLEDVHSIMLVRACERGINLELDYENKIPKTIRSDPRRLKQILVNLIGNGIKFTPSGEVRVTIRYQPGQNTLRFRIRDTGIGISDEQKERLFKPFSQGNERVNRQYGGTGLGLAISRRLVMMLDGEIEVSSVEGKFSEFTFSIATGKDDVDLFDPSRKDLQTSSIKQSDEVQLHDHILIVDDRRDIRFLTKRFLTGAGATVDEAEDGQVAVDWIRQAMVDGNEPRLILLDMQMPQLDGYEAAKMLRRMGYAGAIIALTADAMQGDMNRCIEAGCNDYLPKPIDKMTMLEKIAKMLATS